MSGRRDPFADPRDLLERLYAYVAYRAGDGPDAQDITSEAVERGLRYRESFDPHRGTPLSWLIGIARRCIADHAQKPDPLLAPEPPVESPSPRRDESETATSLAVRALVAELGERDRELVALRYGADLTAREIGNVLEMRTNAVEVALHRVHARLRDDLAAVLDPALERRPRKGLDAAHGT